MVPHCSTIEDFAEFTVCTEKEFENAEIIEFDITDVIGPMPKDYKLK